MNLLEFLQSYGISLVAAGAVLTTGAYIMDTAGTLPMSSIEVAIQQGHCNLDLCAPLKAEYEAKKLAIAQAKLQGMEKIAQHMQEAE